MKLSVIIPCKNEENNVTFIAEKLSMNLKDIKYELIFIDDGSTDSTLSNLKKLNSKDPLHIKIISFSRNFKKEAAMYDGLLKSSGEYTCIIDGDLQQNPEYLMQMIDFLDKNNEYDQVAMVLNKRKDNIIFRMFKGLFYKMINFISDIKFVNGASDFRMFRLNVKDAILQLTESNRFSKGIFSWIGFNTKYLPYKVEARNSGKSKFSFRQSMTYAMDGILGFSSKPLRVATYLGVITSIIAFIYFIYLVIKTLAFGIDVPGYSSTLCIILLLGGIQLITIGILGEYLSKTYLETKRRPIFITKEEIGFDTKKN